MLLLWPPFQGENYREEGGDKGSWSKYRAPPSEPLPLCSIQRQDELFEVIHGSEIELELDLLCLELTLLAPS